jgi:single-stranded DNA-binding protein
MRLQFSGEARKVEHKTIGGKSAVEIQLCKKNYAKQGDEPSFTWLRVTVWEPKEFQKFYEGGFVSGSGELSVRSYTDKDGNKKQSLEVRCTSFDVETPRGVEAQEAPAPAQKPQRPSGGGSVDEPPFARPLIAEVWG